ncbi:MAG: phytanoyl-CoA dioxygenase family protein [Planctomycetota bacterium]
MSDDLWYPITRPTSRGGAFRSALGLTWPDLADAPRWLDGMGEAGVLDEHEVRQFGSWIDDGFLQLPGAIPTADVDAQHMHQDTAYVPVNSPMEMVGVWIALEDVQPGTGELQYFVGSHRIPEYRFDGRWRRKRSDDPDDEPFLRHVYEQSVAAGCELVRFLPKKGDVLVWHADLVHGGAQDGREGATRKSFVTHFCPSDVMPGWMRDGVPHSEIRRHESLGAYTCYLDYAQQV